MGQNITKRNKPSGNKPVENKCAGVIPVAVPEIMANQELVKSINSFSLNFYKEAIKTRNEDNIFCSGYSLSTALSMILVGARSDTATEIRNTLGYQGQSEKQVEEDYHKLLTNQRDNSKGCQLDVANSVWIHQGFNVSREFKDTVDKVYYAEEMDVDFQSSSATEHINKWVSEKTKDKIPQLFEKPLGPLTRLVLVNAMYFKGTWATKFDKKDTTKQPFYLGVEDNQISVEMMYVHNSFPYSISHDLNAQLLELPYDGNDVSMIVILPKEKNGISTLETRLTVSKLEKALSEMHLTEVHVRMPKFKASSTFNLNPTLQSMGIKKAFDERQADFSGINGQRDLVVSQAIQKAVVEVNEKGTEATVATAVVFMLASEISSSETPKIRFTADHPFVYVLRHNSSGVWLFMGSTIKG